MKPKITSADLKDFSPGEPYDLPPKLKAAASVRELLAVDGPDFITTAYLTLLQRAPDSDGYFHYYNRLCRDGDKISIVCDLYRSREAKLAGNRVQGLKAAVFLFRAAQAPGLSWLISLFAASPSRAYVSQRFQAITLHISSLQQDFERQSRILSEVDRKSVV